MKLVPGLYERVVTRGVQDTIAGANDTSEVDREALTSESAPHILGRYFFGALVRALRNLPEEERRQHQVDLTNRLLGILGEAAPNAGLDGDEAIFDQGELLLAVRRLSDARLGTGHLVRPSLPLRHSDLLVNGPRDLRVGSEVRRELGSADAVDVLVSFVKWNGVRILREELAAFAARCPGKLRILTTTYMGATEARALEELMALGADVRVSYDARRTRLHAKAWLFHRESGFSTGLVGSSNLSPSAMLDGCEWNVRLSSVDNRTILDKFGTTFEQYWQDTDVFEPYDRERFELAVKSRNRAADALVQALQLRAYPHQQAALDALALERVRGHHRNLVVAATGPARPWWPPSNRAPTLGRSGPWSGIPVSVLRYPRRHRPLGGRLRERSVRRHDPREGLHG